MILKERNITGSAELFIFWYSQSTNVQYDKMVWVAMKSLHIIIYDFYLIV